MSQSFNRPDDPHIPPSGWVERFAHLVAPGGSVLDVACGHGRHTRYFLERGHPVVAVDIDPSALRPQPGLEIIEADLEGAPWPLPGHTFAGVVVTNYMHRPLMPRLMESLAPGGVLLYATFGQGNERLGRPRNPDFLLAPGELLQAFPGLQVVAYEQGEFLTPKHAIRQRFCGVRQTTPVSHQTR